MKRTAHESFSQPCGLGSPDNSLEVKERMDLSTITNTPENTKQMSQSLPMPIPSNWRVNTYSTPIKTNSDHVSIDGPTSLIPTPYYSAIESHRREVRSFDDIRLPPIFSRDFPCPGPNREFRGTVRHRQPSAQLRQRNTTRFPIHVEPKITVISHLNRPFQVNDSIFKPLEPMKYDKMNQSHDTPPLSPDSTCIRNTVHSNQPYLREHLHCVRYLKEDLHLPWGVVHYKFHQIFSSKPGFIERDSEAALTSRSYRDNFTYASVNGKPLLNYNGVPIRVQAKVRRRRVADEKHIPFKLVEKHPSWAVNYSWVKPEHKLIAQAILDGKDPAYYNSGRNKSLLS